MNLTNLLADIIKKDCHHRKCQISSSYLLHKYVAFKLPVTFISGTFLGIGLVKLSLINC